MVSVCMATYNGERYICEQVASILPQLKETDELVISDDGSTDRTVYLINSFNDERIKLYKNDRHNGIVGNFENALMKSKGDFIFLSDQDDVWLPAKIEVCLKELRNYSLVVSDCYVVNTNLEKSGISFFGALNSGAGVLKNLRKNTYQGCCMCFRKELLPVVLPFPANIPMHDEWIGFVADLFFQVKFEAQPLSLYRRHDSTATSNIVGGSKSTLLKKLSYRWNLLRHVPTLLIKRYL